MSRDKLLINLAFLMKKPTGISIYALNILEYLKFLDLTLLVSHPFPGYNYYTIPDNQTPEQGLNGHLRRLFWTQFTLPKIYDKLQGKLLFSPLPEAPIFSDCRYIITIHDLIPLRFPKPFSPLTYYFRYYLPQVLKNAQHIICNSQATAEDITNFFAIPTQKITVIPLAYDAHNFQPLDRNITACRKGDHCTIAYNNNHIKNSLSSSNNQFNSEQNNLDKPEQLPYFLYIGRHDFYKNLSRLITAFANIKNYQNYQLLLGGAYDNRYTPVLQKQVKELNLTKNVIFLDYIPYEELPIIINQAIALVFPSLWEGFGLPVLEAMGCGTPVITSNLSSLPEVAGDAAILVNPYNIAEISHAMTILGEDQQLRSHYSQLSLQRARQFSWQKTGKLTAEILAQFC